MSLHELDRVELSKDTDGWPAGTRGTVVDLSPESALVEVPDPEYARSLLDSMVDVPFEDLRVLERHAPLVH
jgi:hypothetical protein